MFGMREQELKKTMEEGAASPESTLTVTNILGTYPEKSPLESQLSRDFLEVPEPQIKIEKIEVEEEKFQPLLSDFTGNIGCHDSHIIQSQNLVINNSDHKTTCIKEETDLSCHNIKVDLEFDKSGFVEVCIDLKNIEFIVADQKRNDEIADDIPIVPLPSIPQEENVQDPLEINNYCNPKTDTCSNNVATKKMLAGLSEFFKGKKRLSLDDLNKFCREKKCKIIVSKADSNNPRHQLKKKKIDTNLGEIQNQVITASHNVKKKKCQTYQQSQSVYFYKPSRASLHKKIEVNNKTNKKLRKSKEKSTQTPTKWLSTMHISPPPSPHKIKVTHKTKKKPLKSNKESTKMLTEGFPTIPTDKFCKVKSEVEVSKDEASNSHLQSKKVVKDYRKGNKSRIHPSRGRKKRGFMKKKKQLKKSNSIQTNPTVNDASTISNTSLEESSSVVETKIVIPEVSVSEDSNTTNATDTK